MAVDPYAAAFMTWLSRRAGVSFPEVGEEGDGGCAMVCQLGPPPMEPDSESDGPPPLAGDTSTDDARNRTRLPRLVDQTSEEESSGESSEDEEPFDIPIYRSAQNRVPEIQEDRVPVVPLSSVP